MAWHGHFHENLGRLGRLFSWFAGDILKMLPPSSSRNRNVFALDRRLLLLLRGASLANNVLATFFECGKHMVKKVTGTKDTESRSPKHHSSTTEAMCGSTQPGPTNWTSGPRDLDPGLLDSCARMHVGRPRVMQAPAQEYFTALMSAEDAVLPDIATRDHGQTKLLGFND